MQKAKKLPVNVILAFFVSGLLLNTLPVYGAEELPTIAVSYFVCVSEDTAYADLGPGVSEIISTEISNNSLFNVAERSQIESALEELRFQMSDLTDKTKQAELGRFIGADYVITGTISPFAGLITINTRLIDVETGEVILGESIDSPTVKDLPDTSRELARLITSSEKIKLGKEMALEKVGDIFFSADFEEQGKPENIIIKKGVWGEKSGIREGYLWLGDGDGNSKETCATVLIGDESWHDYSVTGRFYMENTGGDSSFIIHTLVSGNQQTFLILGKGKKPKIVDVYGPTSFNKPKREKSANIAATMAFGWAGALFTSGDPEAYEFGVKDCEAFWTVLGECKDKVKEKGWHTFKVDTIAQEVSVYINDVLILQGGASRDHGNLGFSAVDDCKVYLDDIKVTRIID